MSNSVSVNFKVTGGELSSYLDKIQKKSDDMAQSAIDNAIAQTNSSKEQLAIINQTIAALEKKSRVEILASKSLLQERRDQALASQRDTIEAEKNKIFSQKGLTDAELKERLTAVDARGKVGEENIQKSYNEEIKILKEQERQNLIQSSLAREQIQTARDAAKEQVKEIRGGNKTLADVYKEVGENASQEEQLTISLIEDQLKEDKKKVDKEKGNDSLFNALVKNDLVRGTGQMIGQMPNAKNELEFVKPMTSMLAMSIGGALGSAIDLITGSKIAGTGVGQTQMGVIGAELGKVVGDFVGGSLERSYQGREQLTSKNFALEALTGKDYGVDAFDLNGNGLGGTGKSNITGNLSRYGLDYNQTSDLQYQLAQRQGTANNLQGGAENVVAVEKGLGVSREAIFNLIEVQRSATKENRDFLKTVSGILKEGKSSVFKDDKSSLSEVLGKFVGLQKELLKSQTSVPTGTTMDILMKFNSAGGVFDTKDPRSTDYINSVNNSLKNPDTDFKKSLSFNALRSTMPVGSSIADIIQEQQKGVGSETYMNAMMKLYSSFGDESTQRLAFADLTGGNVEAGTQLLNSYRSGKLENGANFGVELGYGMSEGEIRDLGEAKSGGKYTKSTADIQNMFIDNVATAVSGVGDKMKDLFGSMLGELESFITSKIKGGTDTGAKITVNQTKSPGKPPGYFLFPSEPSQVLHK